MNLLELHILFFTSENAKQAPNLVRVLQEAGQNVNQDLMNIAENITNSKNRTSANNIQFYPIYQPIQYMPSFSQPINYIPSLIYN